jgi:hypothetical protein
MKIFPIPLKKLLELNDRVQQFSIEVDGARACHGCRKKSTSLNRCAKCSLFWYCGIVCPASAILPNRRRANCVPRAVRKLVGTRGVTNRIASYSRTKIFESCLSLNGRTQLRVYRFLSSPLDDRIYVRGYDRTWNESNLAHLVI